MISRRREIVSGEVINQIAEGEETESDKERSDAERQRHKERLIHDLVSDSSDTETGKDKKLKTGPGNIDGADDEDAATTYLKFKKRKRMKMAKSDPPKGSRRRRFESPMRETDQLETFVKSEDEEEEDALTRALPDYLKSRKEKVKAEQDNSTDETGGLNLPPSYEDVDFSDDERLASLEERPAFTDLKPCAPYKDITLPYSLGVIPAPIAQWLREYQVQGASFLHELFVYSKGGILGDDMGLGKTIQVIAFLTAAFGKTGDERDAKRMRKFKRAHRRRRYPIVLVICPGALMENWKSELERWGWWNVEVFHGSPDVKDAVMQAAKAGRVEIVITTYSTYRLNKDAINMVAWDCVVADECHQIKERRAEITKAMDEINALCRIGLTGTAIQNRYEELWTLLNWTNPGRFGPLSIWKSVICQPLKIGQAHDATVPQLAKARTTARKLVENLLPEFFLRRMKTLIADQLPKKSDRVVFCPLTDTQADAYENVVDGEIVESIRTSTDDCDCGSGKKRGWCHGKFLPGTGIPWQSAVFPSMVTLQKLANHLAILIPSGSDSKEKQEKDLDVLETAMPHDWRTLYNKRDNITNFANQEYCGKWKILKKLLRFWHASGDKVLVFSHSVRLLKMLNTLFTTTTPYNVSYLDGSMTYADRARAVDDFNADPNQFVFLISTRAGGVGLNITSANKVVVVDPNWNPSYDLQAQDRAYRIGQTRDVEVFRLISTGTIEEIVYARQIYKQQQANIGYNASLERRYFTGVQENKDKKGEIFGLHNLFAYQGDNVVLRNIVNKTNVAESKAGVSVVGLDMSIGTDDYGEDDDPLRGDDEDEDAVMSQLAALIQQGDENAEIPANKSKKKKVGRKTDAIQAILASAGVEYTHENSEVVGSSKIEERLSRRAQEAGNDVEFKDEFVFPQSQSQPLDQVDIGGDVELGVPEDLGDLALGEGIRSAQAPSESRMGSKYRPPGDVRARQFCTMAETFGYDVTEFALLVESWSQAQRRTCLDKFYKIRKDQALAKAERERS